jgi:hypothetical protein
MQTRKRKGGKRRKTKRGGLGPEVFMMTGLMTVLNGIMLSLGPSFGSFDDNCDKDVSVDAKTIDKDVEDKPLAEAEVIDDKPLLEEATVNEDTNKPLPVATPIS